MWAILSTWLLPLQSFPGKNYINLGDKRPFCSATSILQQFSFWKVFPLIFPPFSEYSRIWWTNTLAHQRWVKSFTPALSAIKKCYVCLFFVFSPRKRLSPKMPNPSKVPETVYDPLMYLYTINLRKLLTVFKWLISATSVPITPLYF